MGFMNSMEMAEQMKFCKICGAEIVNGANGCAMAGNVCFSCKPWNMNRIAPARRTFEWVTDYENAILARQKQNERG